MLLVRQGLADLCDELADAAEEAEKWLSGQPQVNGTLHAAAESCERLWRVTSGAAPLRMTAWVAATVVGAALAWVLSESG